VVINVMNNGINSISSFTAHYMLDGGTTVNESISHTIQPDSSFTYTFPTPITVSGAGDHTLESWIVVNDDANRFNDTSELIITVVDNSTVTYPWSEDFETFANCGTDSDCEAEVCAVPNGWANLRNGNDDDIDWRTHNGPTPSNQFGAGPSIDHTLGTDQGKYMYTESSGNCNGEEAFLITPCIDLLYLKEPKLKFWYHMWGDNMGELHVDIFDGTTWTEDAITSISGDQGDAWTEAEINLLPWIHEKINVRFRGVTGSDWSSDMAIDDIELDGIPPAPGIYENAIDMTGIGVFPNPTEGKVTLRIKSNEVQNTNVEVYNTFGSLVTNHSFTSNAGTTNESMDLSELPKGIYILKVRSGDELKVVNLGVL